MEPDKLVETMRVLEKLKNVTRHSWTSGGRQESVAEHSWRLAVLALLAWDEFPDADICRVVRMCLVHDIGEAFTGDIPSFLKTEDHESAEDEAIAQFLGGLPEPHRGALAALFDEMKAQQTQEAKIFRALDKLEAVAQHNEADIATWLPLEYTLQLTYGAEEAGFSEYLVRLRQAVGDDTVNKIKKEKDINDRDQIL